MKRSITITQEQLLANGPVNTTLQGEGLTSPLDVIALCHIATQQALVELHAAAQQAQQQAAAQMPSDSIIRDIRRN